MKKTLYTIQDYSERIYREVKKQVMVKIGDILIAAIALATPLQALPAEASFVDPEYTIQLATGSTAKATDNLYSRAKENKALSDEWISEIRDLASLPDDWDGEGSAAVQPEAISLSTEIIEKSMFSVRNLTDVSVTPFGSLVLEWEKDNEIINVEVSAVGIAFYCKKDGKFSFGGELNQDTVSVINELLCVLQS